MTRVLHVITGLGPGGAEAVLSQVAAELLRRGLMQHVVSLSGPGIHADSLEAAGVPVTALHIKGALSGLPGVLKLASLIRKTQPDIIQGWMYHGNVIATVARTISCSKARLFWNIRASNMDVERYGAIIRWNARLSRQPDIVITNSRASVEIHREHGLRPRKLEIVHNGIDVERYQPRTGLRDSIRDELGIARDAVVAIVVARVDPMKDHETFLAAMKRLPHIEGLLVGTGTDRLETPVNVTAAGYRADVDRLHQAADVIVSSSAFGEGFSNSLAEGMSSGLVPVVTDVGDAGLIVGDAGHVVSPRSPEMLAAAIEAEASLSPEARRRRGLAARQRIVENFTLERSVDVYERLYSADAFVRGTST